MQDGRYPKDTAAATTAATTDLPTAAVPLLQQVLVDTSIAARINSEYSSFSHTIAQYA